MIFHVTSFENFFSKLALLCLIKHLFRKSLDILLVIKFEEVQPFEIKRLRLSFSVHIENTFHGIFLTGQHLIVAIVINASILGRIFLMDIILF